MVVKTKNVLGWDIHVSWNGQAYIARWVDGGPDVIGVGDTIATAVGSLVLQSVDWKI